MGWWAAALWASTVAFAELPFAWEARPVTGEVRVLPALSAHEPLTADFSSYVGAPLTEEARRARQARVDDAERLPAAVGDALPGALNAALGSDWVGGFTAAAWPPRLRVRLHRALQRGDPLDHRLARVGRSVDGEAVLVTWVDRLSSRALTLDGFPGDLVQTGAGPVVIDVMSEPAVVELRVGVALIAADGEVIVKAREDLHALLSSDRGPEQAGREVARQLAAEMVKVWAR